MLNMKQRQAITKELNKRYSKARKKEKTRILNWFIDLTGYNRCYASCVLKTKEKVIGTIRSGGRKIRYVLEKKRKKKRTRKKASATSFWFAQTLAATSGGINAMLQASHP